MPRTIRATVAAALLTGLTTAACVTATPAPGAFADAPAVLPVGAAHFLGGSAVEWSEDAVRGPDGSWYAMLGLQGGSFPTDPGGYQGQNDAVVVKLTPDQDQVVWAKTIGGSATDEARAIAIGPDDELVVVGRTYSGDFPTSPGTLKTTGDGSVDGFVVRLDAATGALAWSTRLGGAVKEELLDVAVGPDGRIWIAGDTSSPTFPTTADGNGLLNGATDAFLTAIQPDGASLSYSTLIGVGGHNEELSALAFGPGGSLVAAGHLTTWAPGAPTSSLGVEDSSDIAVLRYSLASGTAPVLEHVSYVGAGGYDYLGTIAVAPDGSVLVAGFTGKPGLPLVHAAQETISALGSGMLIKLTPDGGQLAWSTYYGGTGSWQYPHSIAFDAWGAAYVAGETNAADMPQVHPMQPAYGGSNDGYLLKLTADGRVAFASYVGGTAYDTLTAVSLDATGGPVLSGTTYSSADYPSSALSEPGGNGDAVVTRVDPVASTTAPVGPGTRTRDATPTWSFAGNVAGAHTQCRLDAGAWTACRPGAAEATTYTSVKLRDGKHTLAVRALDRPGHPGPSTASTLTVDRTAPRTAIVVHPKRSTTAAKARFRFAAEKGATYTCKVDKRAWRKCGASLTVRVQEGRHTLLVRAADDLGNRDATPARYGWRRR
ncbi:hypothetical protein [Nocardioides sp. URHA0020]|uniref:hypothetical protein n=1 Tax=Nocardioides sp. URHA0020 TaxID=1380392 RepID=UPI0012DFBCA5|nr:hypothetical protein [Nocardioides sp. URHA0020]